MVTGEIHGGRSMNFDDLAKQLEDMLQVFAIGCGVGGTIGIGVGLLLTWVF